ncbi:MAG: 50S ribosomal protein L2 [Candidatus Aenigmarchaeota archaeon]|nr:50S ribosomal protein L2 [Candidatus Aenigmarchaeota archaeon]
MQYRAQSHRYLGAVTYLPSQKMEGDTAKGVVVDIVHDPARNAPVAIIKFEAARESTLQVAPEGLQVGQEIEYGSTPSVGNVIALKDVPVGMNVFCIETFPNSGPKLCRGPGSFASILNRGDKFVTIQFSNGRVLEKPMAKAGVHWYIKSARGKLYPRVSGVAMSNTDHPYGGRRKTPRPSKNVSRNAPPGAKVGSIAARSSGRKHKAKKF